MKADDRFGCLLLFLFSGALLASDVEQVEIKRPGPEFGTKLKAEALKNGSTMDAAETAASCPLIHPAKSHRPAN